MAEIADGEMHEMLARRAKFVKGWENSVSRNEIVFDLTRKKGKGARRRIVTVTIKRRSRIVGKNHHEMHNHNCFL
jgi:hypothetical protein